MPVRKFIYIYIHKYGCNDISIGDAYIYLYIYIIVSVITKYLLILGSIDVQLLLINLTNQVTLTFAMDLIRKKTCL